MHLYLRDEPRTLMLVTSSEEERRGSPSRVLLFRAAEGREASSKAVVELLHKKDVDLNGVTRLCHRPVHGTLGLINVANELFLAVVTSASEIGDIRTSTQTESVQRINTVMFYSLNSATFDDLIMAATDMPLSPSLQDVTDAERDPYSPAYGSSTPQQTTAYDHPCAPLTKILSGGTFYYAALPFWDISSRLEKRLKNKSAAKDLKSFDQRFVWNEHAVQSLLDFRDRLDQIERDEFDRCEFIIMAIQGYVGSFKIALPAPPSEGKPVIATISLISRLGWKRAGTRFNTRGLDDEGNCANFVETETLFSTDDVCLSFVQVRGSVPVFWEQQGVQAFGQRIQITRPPLAQQPAFERHAAQLVEEYSSFHVVNLLGQKENEAILTSAYTDLMRKAQANASEDAMGMTNFDFHAHVRAGGHESVQELARLDVIRSFIERSGFTIADMELGEVVTQQQGVFRTNCLDCLDRTNFVQDIFSREVLQIYFRQNHRANEGSHAVWSYHRELWAENGDALSRIYAGTGALNTSFTRSGKRTLGGFLSDATKSVGRMYINNFQDKGKQTAIDMFLGNLAGQQVVTIYDPIHDAVRLELAQRLSEYSERRQILVFTGTWNVNGRPPSESIMPWLFPRPDSPVPDIIALGFQEIVPLTAQQVVQTDPEKKRDWELLILDTLMNRPDCKTDYILLRSEQLVGTALIVLVKTELASVIKNVEGASKKTGLRGMAGNKGAVGIRLEYYETPFCFVTAHLAAGHANAQERNDDYRTVVHGLHFQRGKTIGSHENVIWMADTNYRIDLSNEEVRGLIEADALDELLAADQLTQARDMHAAFAGYDEGPVLFRPTYRYDLHSDDYDTSEKQRIPAWTDRILYRGSDLDLSVYSRAELKTSDHRPVFAIFRAQVRVIDTMKRAALREELLQKVRATTEGETLDQKLQRMTVNGDELPPPSSDENAWWDSPNHPDGVVSAVPPPPRGILSTNPFDLDIDIASSESDEELYSAAATLPVPLTPSRRPMPPPPPPKPASLSSPR
ncbi:inositol polyphosphate phosphatase [Dacryopinax primogenitus]|uniref:phosphoinositide 5-phosphatase n=1 Tax=Dacryopinax primogenitus (strain DJM 731) TaxID=1858805 RepID=M5GGZ2_DACPD|nr:inositol polyphosphate phosphatase [Dacryopinax primogenitus]EJU06333.1 inositol polyphosphate phosphatase [Dacryopinax primogenitus]